MGLTKIDKRLELQSNFGTINSKDFKKLYYKYNNKFLKMLKKIMKKENISIADYGGGNGILSTNLLKDLNNLKVDIIDIDDSKFIHRPNLKNIKANMLHFKNKEYYDYSISRHTIHYLNQKEQLLFFKNVYSNLKQNGYFLLINWVIDDPKVHTIKDKILTTIQNLKNISKRTIPTTKTILENLTKIGFKTIKIKKVNYKISINDFYKSRFNLSESEIKTIIETIKTKKHKETQIAILLKK